MTLKHGQNQKCHQEKTIASGCKVLICRYVFNHEKGLHVSIIFFPTAGLNSGVSWDCPGKNKAGYWRVNPMRWVSIFFWVKALKSLTLNRLIPPRNGQEGPMRTIVFNLAILFFFHWPGHGLTRMTTQCLDKRNGLQPCLAVNK